MTASIRELCTADHHDDPAVIAAWTTNKTPAQVARMLANPHAKLFVALVDGAVAAVGSVQGIAGEEIGLNYVHPSHRFRGVSRALLAAMEQEMRGSGIATGRLISTATAKRFYESAGWVEDGPVDTSWIAPGWPMKKRL